MSQLFRNGYSELFEVESVLKTALWSIELDYLPRKELRAALLQVGQQ